MTGGHPLVFGEIGPAHAVALHELWSDPEVVRLTNWELTSSEEDAAQRIGRLRSRYGSDPNRLGPYVATDTECGVVGLVGIDFVAGEHEVWYLVPRRLWGRGYGSGLLGGIVQRAAGRTYGKLVATAVVDNVASWKLLERHGFRRTATLAAGFQRHGIVADLYRYERAGPFQ